MSFLIIQHIIQSDEESRIAADSKSESVEDTNSAANVGQVSNATETTIVKEAVLEASADTESAADEKQDKTDQESEGIEREGEESAVSRAEVMFSKVGT